MSLTLYYLPFRGRAEPIRMILSYANIPFEDVTISFADWNFLKTSGAIAPFGQLPSVRLPSGEILAQSGSIIRLVAKLARVYPDDPYAAARADMILEFAHELNLIDPLLNFWSIYSETWKQNRDAFFSALPRHLEVAQRLLGYGPFFGGTMPHFGDFAFLHVLDASTAMEPHCLNEFPALQRFVDSMRSLPGVRAYLQRRLPPVAVGMAGSFIQLEMTKPQGNQQGSGQNRPTTR